jgi:sigma-E factor negative regulatory protein RseA
MTILESSSERLSALADGELGAGTAADMQDVFESDALHRDWNSYQVIGQVLRGEASSSISADPAFLQRLNLRLAHEKVAPALLVTPGHGSMALPNQPAANESVFRWKLVAGFASLAATLVVAWSLVGLPAAPTGAQLAQNPPTEQVVVASPQGPMVRDARLEELMAAHKQLGGSSLQAPSGFLRNAGFENSQSSRR